MFSFEHAGMCPFATFRMSPFLPGISCCVCVLLSRCFCFSLLVSSIFSPWVSSSVSAGFCTSYFSKSWQDMKNIKRCFWIWCWPFWESIKWLKNRALISPFWFAHPLSFTKTTPNLAKIDSFVLLLHIHT